MSSIQAAIRAAALHRAKRAALPAVAGRKAVLQAAPLLRHGLLGRPLKNRDWPLDTAIDKYFKLSALVYRGVIASAVAVGSVRWQTEVKTADKWERVEDHPLQALLDTPHAFFNRQAWNEVLVMHLALAGNALFQKTTASGRLESGAKRGRILEMVPLVPKGIDPVPDPERWVAKYLYQGPPRREWEPEEILHVMLPDPGNPFWGMSPLKAAGSVIGMDLEAVRWNATSMANRAIADGVFSFEKALTAEQYEEQKDQLWEQHQGPENAHEPWVLGGGAKWQEMSRSPVEMDFNETRMRTREEILSSLGIPPVMAGFFENATLANAEASRRLFWEDTTIPTYVERINAALNSGVVPHFGDARRLRVSYDISGIPALREDLGKKINLLRVATASGTPYNQAIDELELDLEPIEHWGDLPFGLEQFRVSIVAGAAPGVDGGDPAALPVDPFGQSARTPGALSAGAGQEVRVAQDAVLNGAQITAATAIVTAVVSGEMPRDAGIGQLVVLFNLDPEQAEQMMGSAGTGTPTTPNPRPGADGVPPETLPPPPPPPAKGRRPSARKAALGVQATVFATDIADQEAPAIRRAFLAEIAKLRDGATVEELATLVRAADAAAAIQKLGAHQLTGRLNGSLGPVLERTMGRGADLAAEQLARELGANLSLDSGRLASWLRPYLNDRVAQLTNTTEAAAREFFFDLASGKLGDDPEAAARLLRETWGLHRQQASGVRSVYRAALDRGKTPNEAAEMAATLARTRLAERAKTIAEHESLVAANRGNGAMFEQALDDGAVAMVTATWMTAEDEDVDEECYSLNEQEIDVATGDRFHGASGATYREPPEPHPGCRCGLFYGAIA